MKNILSISALFSILLAIQIYGQPESIKEFPRQYESQEINDLTPVWISSNEILTFYKNSTKDTIFSRRTTNLGQTWSSQKFERAGEGINSFYYEMYLFKTSSGRLLFFYISKDLEIKCYFSDNNGISWMQATQTTGSVARDLSVMEIEPGKIILSFSSPRWRTHLSTDNGETWIDENYIIPPSQFGWRYINPQFIKISENGDSVLGIYSSTYGIIYSLFSSDRGNTWSDSTRIVDPHIIYDPYYKLTSLKTIYDRTNNIWLIFDAQYDIENEDYSQSDVSVLKSTDKGNSWQQMNRFTSYLGDDFLGGITGNGEDIFVCFNSSRNEIFNQGFYGILGQSEDTNTPPILLNTDVVGIDYDKKEVNYRAKVIDDQGVLNVIARLDQINQSIELFDDGSHNDSLANDNIFGNVLPINSSGRAGDAYAMDLNNITLPFNRKGVIADVDIDYKGFSFEIEMTDIFNNVGSKETSAYIPIKGGGGPTGKFDGHTFLFASGFFLSGYSNDELWSNAVASSTLVEDYMPGKTGSNTFDPLNQIYVVNKRDPAFGFSWQNWKDAVSLGAEFYDGDNDGIYNPVDKDWNGTWEPNEDMPPLIGDEIAWCVYHDGLPANQRRWQSEPKGIEVRQTIFATDKLELENVIFIRYSILNTGLVAGILDSVYFGVWEDGDLGDYTDDVVGCDTLLNSAYYYNNEPDYIYGENCPAFFTTFLQKPVIETNDNSDTAKLNYGQLIGSEKNVGAKNIEINSHVFFAGGDPNLNDPGTAVEARCFMEGKTKQCAFPDPCTFPYCEVKGGVVCDEINPLFWASGDPVSDIGWINKLQINQINLISTGPFKLEKDKPQEIIIAYVIGRGTDYFNSITVARENVQRVIEEYESNFASMTYSPPPAASPVTSYILYQNYPNPFNPFTTIRYELPQDGVVTIDIYDILGQKVKTILNEFKRADRYEVTFNSAGLASGVYIYRMKVNEFITSKKMVLVK